MFTLLEKETATHSSIHALKIPWTEEPGWLQSMGSQRVGHDWATSVCVCVCVCVCVYFIHFIWEVRAIILRRLKRHSGWEQEFKFSSAGQLCLSLCNPIDCSTPSFPVHHQLPEHAQTHVLQIVMPSNHLILCHPLLLLPSIFPSISLFQWVSSLYEVAKVLEFQL